MGTMQAMLAYVVSVWVGVWLSVGKGTMPSTASQQCNAEKC